MRNIFKDLYKIKLILDSKSGATLKEINAAAEKHLEMEGRSYFVDDYVQECWDEFIAGYLDMKQKDRLHGWYLLGEMHRKEQK